MLPSIHHPRYQALQGQLKTLRQDAGFTQVQLAERLGIHQTYLSKIERGERYIDVLLYLDWCRACDAVPDAALKALIDAGA
ncbi:MULTISPECIES: helix-turn-helix domain-containing protein [Burkholderia]|uniref:helix-turn-helix domain-containing protein n=1 Tax=Burkholderia TaxID=32008 RepID=UPI000751AC59|nr:MULTISPECIES: helix-turn-helix transcriptional regulator [Burkholderia]KVE75815.1 DNA-binding protein [Burkholderia vietnamiensis]MCM2539253.1 helix-turn-helix domain-containing protein [Burkholderia glumae]